MKISLNHYSDLPVLETDRLLLKPLNKSYLSQNYVDWMNDGEVNRYLESGGNYNLKKLNEYLMEVERNPKYFWAIILKEIIFKVIALEIPYASRIPSLALEKRIL